MTRPKDALEVLTKVRPDLLVLDVGLPEMSGLELYDRVHADERFERLPVIFETAVADRHRSEFKRRGISAIVEKPFDINDVVRQVRQLAPPPARLH